MILATRHGDVELRDASLGATMRAVGMDMRGGATVSVNERTVGGISAATRAIRGASEAVAKLGLCVFRGKGIDRREVASTWQARFFAGVPGPGGRTWFQVWEQTETLLSASGNAYWLKARDASSGRVQAVVVVPRGLLRPRWNADAREVEYVLGSEVLAASEVVHFRGWGDPGELEAPSPIDRHRDVLAAAISRQRHESKFWSSGTGRALAGVFPREVTPQQAAEFREVYRETFGDPDRQSDLRVLGGGMTLTTVGLTMEEAQFIQAAELTVEECARVFAWPSSLIGGAKGGKSDQPISPEHESQRTLEHYLVPRLVRIEQTILADPDWFGVGARDYPLFQTEGFVRGDVKTESEMLVREVQSGIRLVDEARAERGLPPLPGGVGKIPQIVPVGGTPNPVPTPPPADPPAPSEASRRDRGDIVVPEVRVAIPEIRMEQPAPQVVVNVPEQPAPVVHVQLPEQPAPEVVVNVAPAPVEVTVPAPVVHVDPTIVVQEPSGTKKVEIKRDPLGRIAAAEIIEEA